MSMVATASASASSGDAIAPVKVCQMAKLDPFLSLGWARVEGVDGKGSNFAA